MSPEHLCRRAASGSRIAAVIVAVFVPADLWALDTFTEQPPISTSAVHAASVVAADADRDGDTDVITAECGIDAVVWYENDRASPPGWTKRMVGHAQGPITVSAADADGDGDLDVFSAYFNDERIAW